MWNNRSRVTCKRFLRDLDKTNQQTVFRQKKVLYLKQIESDNNRLTNDKLTVDKNHSEIYQTTFYTLNVHHQQLHLINSRPGQF